jgi:hypothetical protein
MRQIQLSQGKVALVDEVDFEWLNQWKWSALKRGQTDFAAYRVECNGGKQKGTLMHRQIMKAEKGQEIDHKNRNPLDNQRENLRLATRQQQCLNRRGNVNRTVSKFKGVTRHPDGRWRTWFRAKHVGLFKTEEAAARAYDREATDFDPEFACLNFPAGGVSFQA